MKRRSLFAAAALVSALVAPLMSHAQAPGKTLRVVPHANITILDPIWTTAFVTRNHGYMIYDTLFGTDLAGKV
jgi:peptide/nickel transport system substrate-binding protein